MKAVYAGSFDPITNGHVWMIERAAGMFGQLLIAVGVNPDKRATFNVARRVGMIREVTGHIPNVQVGSFTNKYLARFAAEVGAGVIIRGIRNEQDYGYERGMRYVNEQMNREITTVFLIPPRNLVEVSSSFVKGLVGPEGWHAVVREYVPSVVYEALAIAQGEFDVDGLKQKWTALMTRLGLDAHRSEPAFRQVIEAYASPARRYHNVFHLEAVVAMAHDLARQHGGWTPDLDELEAGLWYHDIVYDATRHDNEVESARIAAGALGPLGLPAERIDRISRIITATRHDGSARTAMEKLACDIDLVPLAVADETFRRNTEGIRHEYQHLTDAEFRQGRIAFLEKMLAKEQIFYGDSFQQAYGAKAAVNMQQAIRRLASEPA